MTSHLYVKLLCTLFIGAVASAASFLLALVTDEKTGRNRIWGIVSLALLGLCVAGSLATIVALTWSV